MNLVSMRRKLDQLIWGPEILAQEYEGRIVELWDALLKAKNKFAVLAAFAFNSLQLAAHQKSDPLQLNIARYSFAGAGQTWSNAQFQAFINGAVDDGYRLEQTEWHHAAFHVPQFNLGARSEVNFELHIARADPAHRLIIKGVLNINWSVGGTSGIDVSADTISVASMTILERELPSAFQEVFRVSGTEESPLVHPLLINDLDKDGLSEIIVAGQNLVLRNHGEGKLVSEPLFEKPLALYDGAVIGDFSGDGDKDIFIANGHYSGESTQDYCTTFWRHDIYEEGGANIARDMLFQVESTDLREANISWNGYEHKVLFLKHNNEYVNIAYLMGVAFEYDARAVITEDIDNDGRPDLLVVEYQADGLNKAIYRLHVYRNTLAQAGHWVGVQLIEQQGVSNIGANIEVTTPAGSQENLLRSGQETSGAVNVAVVSIGSTFSGQDAILQVEGSIQVQGSIQVDGVVAHADFVFASGYDLMPIEQRADFMWEQKHLPALPKAPEGLKGNVNLVSHQMGILEELEVAHIYIQQLHQNIASMESRLDKLEQSKN